jgi:hypothetical protein
MLSDEQLLARITSPHPTCRHGDELYPMYPQYEMSGRIVCWVCVECGCVVFPEVRKEANVLAESLKERDAEIAAHKAELEQLKSRQCKTCRFSLGIHRRDGDQAAICTKFSQLYEQEVGPYDGCSWWQPLSPESESDS